MSGVQSKTTSHAKKQERKKSIKTDTEIIESTKLVDKNIKTVVKTSFYAFEKVGKAKACQTEVCTLFKRPK